MPKASCNLPNVSWFKLISWCQFTQRRKLGHTHQGMGWVPNEELGDQIIF